MEWSILSDQKSILGESPVWDVVNERIIWIDIIKGDVCQFYIKENKFKTFHIGNLISSIALKRTGGLVATTQNGFVNIDLNNGDIKTISNPESHLQGNRFNDGKCDPAGRFWAGTMSLSGKRSEGSLYALEPDLSVSVKIKRVSCSNGIAWSPDHSVLYYIDTPTQQVVAYDYNILTGDLKNKMVVITIPEKEGFPDGMTIDSEGMLWIALWDGWKIERWNPYTGQLLHRILLPVAKITSCTFGGESLEDIFITSARTGLSEKELEIQPLAGSLFIIKNSGFKGLPAHEFLG